MDSTKDANRLMIINATFSDANVYVLKILKLIKHEPASEGAVGCYCPRIAITSYLQRVIKLPDEGHQGQVKIEHLLRSKVWFPYMDSK